MTTYSQLKLYNPHYLLERLIEWGLPKSTRSIFLCFCLLALYMQPTFAQGAEEGSLTEGSALTEQPKSEEETKLEADLDKLKQQLEILKVREAIAESKRKIAEAEVATFKATLPESNVEPLPGNIQVTQQEKPPIETEVIAYEAIKLISQSIHDSVAKVKPRPRALVIYDESLKNLFALYSSYQSELNVLLSGYEREGFRTQFGLIRKLTRELNVESFGGIITRGLTATEAYLGSIVDIISLFRTDTQITQAGITPNEDALVFQFASNVQSFSSEQIKVFYPKFYLLEIPNNDASRLGAQIEKIAREIYELLKLKSQAEQQLITELDRARAARLKTLNKEVEAFIGRLKTGSQDQSNPITLLAKAARLESVLRDGGNVLYMEVIRAGGNSRIRRNLFTGNKLRHNGAAIVNYMLFDSDGAIKLSNTLSLYSGYIKLEGSDILLQEIEAK